MAAGNASVSAWEGDGTVIWVTGLAEAGKSTVARELVRQLEDTGLHPILLDGDEVRRALGMTGSYDRDSRIKAAMTYARLCNMLARKGHLVVIATISLFHEVQRWNREHQPGYFEVLLDVPFSELKRRDSKGIYSKYDGEEIVGIGQQAEFPVDPDLVIHNYAETDPESAAALIRISCEYKGVLTAFQEGEYSYDDDSAAARPR